MDWPWSTLLTSFAGTPSFSLPFHCTQFPRASQQAMPFRHALYFCHTYLSVQTGFTRYHLQDLFLDLLGQTRYTLSARWQYSLSLPTTALDPTGWQWFSYVSILDIVSLLRADMITS